jgi:two-component system, chemotaxis family, CheB/CheR fusion protein
MENSEETKIEKSPPKTDFFPIVGIGASAGGLEAIETFLSGTPPEPGLAIVVIQHLSPDYTSMMDNLLKKYTKMTISTIEHKTRIKSNHIYLNPPDMEVAIYDGVLHLEKPMKTHRTRTPIDHFFRSLARDQKSGAIGIIFSGSGSDGTLGLKEIRGAGGITFVQDPKEAKFDMMPRNALFSDAVDFSLNAGDMFNKLQEYIKNRYIGGKKKLNLTQERFQNQLDKIFKLIQKSTGHDFSNYKPTTVLRRIERRMALHKIDDLKTYVQLLQENPQEVNILFKELLIKVTSFFRDPEAFEALKKEVIYDLVKKTNPEDTLRIWVPACASGEEAYSIAILFLEVMEELDQYRSMHFFATDIDEESIENGRVGEYRESISMDVSEERLNRFFHRDDSTYRIKKEIREKIVFAVHNIIKDPPFSRIDLISCRNLMIYLENNLQNKLFSLIHYSLKQEGYLFLGTSETIDSQNELFSIMNNKYKIYKVINNKPKEFREYTQLPFSETLIDMQMGKVGKEPERNIRMFIQNLIINEYSPPGILVNEKLDIIFFSGNTEKYLLPPIGEPSFNFFEMARQGLRHILNTKIRDAIKHQSPITCENVQIKYGDKLISIDVIVRPLVEMGYHNNLFLVLFKEREDEQNKPAKANEDNHEDEANDENFKKLKEELVSLKKYYQSTLEELQSTNEELRASNEELQSTNEELQSTNEEHETSKEELQSTNEELISVNAELDNKIKELEQAYSDMNNFLASTEIGTLFLDKELKIRRFTPTIRNIFNLIPQDVGRPLSDIASKIPYRNIIKDAEEVLDTLNRKEADLQSSNGSRFTLRILPYRTIENIIDGVVLTFIDVSRLIKAKGDLLKKTSVLLNNDVMNLFRESILVLDSDMKVKSANNSFYDFFKTSPNEIENKLFYQIVDGRGDISHLKSSLDEILEKKSFFKDLEIKQDFPDIGHKIFLLNARAIEIEEDKIFIIIVMEDMTQT